MATVVLPTATKATATTTTRRAAIAQLCSTKNKYTNLLNIAKCAGYAKSNNAVMLFLPECCGFMGENAHHTLMSADPAINVDAMSMRFNNNDINVLRKALANQINIHATTTTPTSNTLTNNNDSNNYDEDDDWPEDKSFTSSIIEELRYIAVESQLWISGGGIHTRATTPSSFSSSKDDDDANNDANNSDSNEKIYNTHVIIDNEGRLHAHYHKIHLFDVNIPNSKVYLQESKTTLPGNTLVTCDSPIGKLGLSICYDMRFSEMYVDLVSSPKLGAQILLMPSAFTIPTGKAHWHTLLRARAIECQCYVIAAAQVGKHNEKRESYGHSVVYDPWGELLVDAGGVSSTTDEEDTGTVQTTNVPSIIFADIDLENVACVRERLPIQKHRDSSYYSY